MISGFLLVYKDPGITSSRVVQILKKKFNLNKVGHLGTLDPMASGLLIICIGKFTKRISEYQKKTKTYTGKFKLGETTPSYDGETKVNETFSYNHIREIDLINFILFFCDKQR